LRDKYNINVEYSRVLRGYTVEGPEDYFQQSFRQFAQSQVMNGVFQDLLEKGVQVWDVIGVDDQYPKMSMPLLKAVVTAAVEHQRINLTYLKFYDTEPKNYLLEPQYIKQVEKRWYLYAYDVNDSYTLKTFGLERATAVELMADRFPSKTELVKTLSRSTYGVTNFNEPKELVVLRTNHWQGKYFETLPVHQSQQIAYLDDDICEIKLNISLNPELMQLLASQRQTIKVVAPLKLKTEYKKFIQRKLKDLD
jgi:predicted DNA-binding transcriptional regulator YafY